MPASKSSRESASKAASKLGQASAHTLACQADLGLAAEAGRLSVNVAQSETHIV